jgi:chemotaxis family two-component system response regulator Rcp1
VQLNRLVSGHTFPRSIHLLLIEDSPSDIWLVREALRLAQLPARVTVARDGVEATDYLRQVEKKGADCPDLILLDLNLPRKNGREVLADINASSDLKPIPIMVLSSSDAEDDMRDAYDLNARCFLTKPNSLPGYVDMMRGMERFWLSGLNLRQTA